MRPVVPSTLSSPSPFGALFSRDDINGPYDEMFDALAVGVSVGPALASLSGHAPPFVPWMSRDAAAPLSGADPAQPQQQ